MEEYCLANWSWSQPQNCGWELEGWLSGIGRVKPAYVSIPHSKSKWRESPSVVSNSLWPHGLHSSWNSPGRNTGVNSLSCLQGIFPSQELNPSLLHCRQILYQLSHKGSPRILKWVVYPFSSRSSWPRNWTRVSCITGGFFTNWAIRKASKGVYLMELNRYVDVYNSLCNKFKNSIFQSQ